MDNLREEGCKGPLTQRSATGNERGPLTRHDETQHQKASNLRLFQAGGSQRVFLAGLSPDQQASLRPSGNEG